jgi:hypothetical protein
LTGPTAFAGDPRGDVGVPGRLECPPRGVVLGRPTRKTARVP